MSALGRRRQTNKWLLLARDICRRGAIHLAHSISSSKLLVVVVDLAAAAPLCFHLFLVTLQVSCIRVVCACARASGPNTNLMSQIYDDDKRAPDSTRSDARPLRRPARATSTTSTSAISALFSRLLFDGRLKNELLERAGCWWAPALAVFLFERSFVASMALSAQLSALSLRAPAGRRAGAALVRRARRMEKLKKKAHKHKVVARTRVTWTLHPTLSASWPPANGSI